jgi:hypothetical protein
MQSKGRGNPLVISKPRAVDLFSVLDQPAIGSRISQFLPVSDTTRLVLCSWMLYKGVIGRTVGFIHHSFRECGFDGRGSSRIAAWLYSCGPSRRSPLADMKTVGVEGVCGEIDRDICRTFPERPLFHITADIDLGPGGHANASTWEQLGPSSGLVMLRRVLHTFNEAHPEIGYCQVRAAFVASRVAFLTLIYISILACKQKRANLRQQFSAAQGMNYVAATLLELSWGLDMEGFSASNLSFIQQRLRVPGDSPSDTQVRATFELLQGLSSSLGCRDLWAPGLPRLPCLASQLSEMTHRCLVRRGLCELRSPHSTIHCPPGRLILSSAAFTARAPRSHRIPLRGARCAMAFDAAGHSATVCDAVSRVG